MRTATGGLEGTMIVSVIIGNFEKLASYSHGVRGGLRFVRGSSSLYNIAPYRLSSGLLTVNKRVILVVWSLGRFCTAAQEMQILRRAPTSFARRESPLRRH